jgi:cytosine/adenosine deaminase-related metal-dependent hydrolase
VASGDLARVAAASADRPLHVHLSEQPAENHAAQAYYGRTPAALLGESGALTPRTTVVHATHLSVRDIQMLGDAQVTACFCPTTEQDLADGIGPARALADAGARLSLGSDQNAVVDLIGEARALESGERLASLRRGRFRPDELLAAATAHGSLGWPDAGAIAPGMRADLVCVRTDTVRTAGADPAQILLAATAADIDSVWVDGAPVVSGGVHRLGDVAGLLCDAIGGLWEPP